MADTFCMKCGTELPAGAEFCRHCGTAVPPEPEPKPRARRPKAIEPVSPPPAEPLPDEPPPSRKSTLLYVVIAGVVAVALIGGVLVATRGSKSPPGTEAGEVFLEPADFTATDPFTDSVDTSTAPPPVQLVSASPTVPASPTAPASPPASPTPPEPTGIRSVQGSAPGLYGGTQDESACDATRLVQFLQSDPAKGAAWAAALGITPAAIPDFVAGLTPLVLRADTRVTNHGYSDGRATPLQSVLQAGTAVLVDDLGIPRVKCGCGNPLLPPVAQAQGVRYTGTKWPGFRPANVLVVVNTVQIRVTKFILVDLVRPGFFTRPVGAPPEGTLPADGTILIDEFCDLFPEDCRPPTLEPGGAVTTPVPGEPELGTGDVQVTLRWSSTADLDLAVIDPGGERVDFNTPTSSSGGQLDVDSNGGCTDSTTSPVENVFWPAGQSPDGEYTIEVSYYQECSGGTGPQAFDLQVLMGGQPVAVQTMAAPGEPAFTLLAAESSGATGGPAVLGEAGTLNAPGDKVTVSATKGEGTGTLKPPGEPWSFTVSSVGVEPGSLYISWGPSFKDPPEVGIEDAYEMTVEPGGESFLFPNGLFELTLPGLEPGVEYTFTMVAVNAAGKSAPVTATGKPEAPAEEEPPEEPPAPPPPEPETLEEYCDRMYPPPPSIPAENPQWTLCMHDPTGWDSVDPGSLPISFPPPETA